MLLNAVLTSIALGGATDVTAALAALQPAEAPGFRLHAIEFATAPTAPSRLFTTDPARKKTMQAAFAFWLVADAKRRVLIDCGFERAQVPKGWSIRRHRSPRDARVWLTAGTLRGIRKRKGKAWQQVQQTIDAAEATQRLRMVEGPVQIVPSIALIPVGLHTPGFLFVAVENPGGRWVFASDIVPLAANARDGFATGQTSNRTETVELSKRMLDWVGGNVDRIVPGHDGAVFEEGSVIELGSQPRQ